MKMISIVSVLALAAANSAAAQQTPPPQSPPSALTPNNLPSLHLNIAEMGRLRGTDLPLSTRLFQEQLNRRIPAAQAITSERMVRAGRVAELIDAGSCKEAIALAHSERDPGIERNARTLCHSSRS